VSVLVMGQRETGIRHWRRSAAEAIMDLRESPKLCGHRCRRTISLEARGGIGAEDH
jgi:hypothetical protein